MVSSLSIWLFLKIAERGVYMNQKITIAINREYGSGGRTIGEMISKDLGIPYYDKQLEEFASEDSGIAAKFFTDAEENFKNRLLVESEPYTGEILEPDDKDYTTPKNLFALQAKTIHRLCDAEACVMVGHGAGFVLKDRTNVIRIFVHADKEHLLERAALRMSLSPKELEKYVEKENKRRADYNFYYTGEKWDDAHNYDISLNSSNLGLDKCLEVIEGYMKVRFDGLELRKCK